MNHRNQVHPARPPVTHNNPMYDPDPLGKLSTVAIGTGVPIESGFWVKIKKPWWPLAKAGVLIGAGVFTTGVILCACHVPIGGLLIAGGIIIMVGAMAYAIFTDPE